jgi:hypothetical protein
VKDRGIWGRFSTEERPIPFPKHKDQPAGGEGVSFVSGRFPNLTSLPSTDIVMKMWSYTSTPPCALMAYPFLSLCLGNRFPYSDLQDVSCLYYSCIIIKMTISISCKRSYLLTPWSRVLLEKLTGFAAGQEIPRIYGTPKFITLLTSARHLSLS